MKLIPNVLRFHRKYTGTLGLHVQHTLSYDICCSHCITAALRLCRKIIGLKDEFYYRYIVRNNLLAPIVKAFIANGRRYNLLNSAIIELFEYLKVVSVCEERGREREWEREGRGEGRGREREEKCEERMRESEREKKQIYYYMTSSF